MGTTDSLHHDEVFLLWENGGIALQVSSFKDLWVMKVEIFLMMPSKNVTKKESFSCICPISKPNAL